MPYSALSHMAYISECVSMCQIKSTFGITYCEVTKDGYCGCGQGQIQNVRQDRKGDGWDEAVDTGFRKGGVG